MGDAEVPGKWCSSPHGMAVAPAAWDGSDLFVIKPLGLPGFHMLGMNEDVKPLCQQ